MTEIEKEIKKLIVEAIKKFTRKDGTLNSEPAKVWLYEQAAAKHRRFAAIATFGRNLHSAFKRGRASLAAVSSDQFDFADIFPGLFEAYTILRPDGEKSDKQTARLSMDEFISAMRLRGDQIENDRASLNHMEFAFNAVEPFWKKNPKLEFGAVFQLYVKALQKKVLA